jgi:hypothetical protein
MNCLSMQPVARNRSGIRPRLISPLRSIGFALGLLVITSCPAQNPPRGRERFADVALKLRAFPPDRIFFVDSSQPGGDVRLVGPPMDLRIDINSGWPVPPGVAEYRALIEADNPVPFLLSLLKDPDPKIRTLAAAALVAKGDPRLQRHLSPLVHDQSSTFDAVTVPPTASYIPPRHTPQTVAMAVLQLVEMRSADAFDQYWAVRANREYCAGWFLWQFLHPRFASVARRQIQRLPSPDRELTILWIGRGLSNIENRRYTGYSDKELLDAAKSVGRINVLATLRNQAPTADPDIRDISGADRPSFYLQNFEMGRFLLAHSKDLLKASDADALLDLEIGERSIKNPQRPVYRELWPIAAASLRPRDAGAILDAAEMRWPDAGDIQLARWDIQGPAALPKILQRFYQNPRTQEELAQSIYLFYPNDAYQPLVEAILASDGHLQISGKAMYLFGVLARAWKANFDPQIADWVFAQPPDPDIGIMSPSRRLVVSSSGVARKLILDPRFNKADGQLLYVVEQSQAGELRLDHTESVRLDQLIKQLYSQHPQSTPEPILEETRTLLREGVGVN